MIVRHPVPCNTGHRAGLDAFERLLINLLAVSGLCTYDIVAGNASYEMSYWINLFPCFKFQIIRKLGHHGNIKKEIEKKKYLELRSTSLGGEES